MAIQYSSAGAGASSESSGAAVSPASPATVNAGDILIVHAYFEGTATTPSTPDGFTLLAGPEDVGTTAVGRHWIFGKVAAGTEDGAANALGTAAVTTMRAGRCYSFTGRVSGTITDLVLGFTPTTHATDPQMPTVTTTIAGGLAVACIAQNDNNTAGDATGESGGDWVEAVAEYVAALAPGLMLQIQTCTPTADPGTVTGGSVATANDPCGAIGFEIRPSVPLTPITGDGSTSASAQVSASAGTVAISGTAATTATTQASASSGVVLVTGAGATSAGVQVTAGEGTVASGDITGDGATSATAQASAAVGSVAVAGSQATSATAQTTAAIGTVAIIGTAATSAGAETSAATGTIAIAGTLATGAAAQVTAGEGSVDDGETVGVGATIAAPQVSVGSGSVAICGTLATTASAHVSAATGTVGVACAGSTTSEAQASAGAGHVDPPPAPPEPKRRKHARSFSTLTRARTFAGVRRLRRVR
jgi:hypothetical protein